VRNLLKILIGGFIAFMALAIAQEWEFFSSAWFGRSAPAPVLSESQRQEAGQALYLFLQVSSHFYSSGGDPRFAERLPAGEGVLAELRDDVEYLDRNTRFQDPQLARLEVVAADLIDGGRIELRTREWWHVRTRWLADSTDSDPPRVFKSFGRYLLVEEESIWKIAAWEPLHEDPAPGTVLEVVFGTESRPIP